MLGSVSGCGEMSEVEVPLRLRGGSCGCVDVGRSVALDAVEERLVSDVTGACWIDAAVGISDGSLKSSRVYLGGSRTSGGIGVRPSGSG